MLNCVYNNIKLTFPPFLMQCTCVLYMYNEERIHFRCGNSFTVKTHVKNEKIKCLNIDVLSYILHFINNNSTASLHKFYRHGKTLI